LGLEFEGDVKIVSAALAATAEAKTFEANVIGPKAVHTNKFVTRPACQFASISGAYGKI